jgi:hypothetical protein
MKKIEVLFWLSNVFFLKAHFEVGTPLFGVLDTFFTIRFYAFLYHVPNHSGTVITVIVMGKEFPTIRKGNTWIVKKQ